MITKLTLKAKIYLFIASGYSLLILILSLVNLNKVEIVKLEASDKVYHTVCYALMSFLWCYYAKLKLKKLKINFTLVLILSISTFGTIIEVLQLTLTNYRAFDWWDVLANFIGIILGIVLFKLSQKIFN